MLERLTYPVTLTPDEDDGGFVVTFIDVPHAITQGDTVEDCLTNAVDCLEEALASCIDEEEPIPEPSPIKAGDIGVSPSAQVSLKLIVYMTWRDAGISKTELARRMGIKESEARRILDPRHGTKLPTLEQALRALDKQISISINDRKVA